MSDDCCTTLQMNFRRVRLDTSSTIYSVRDLFRLSSFPCFMSMLLLYARPVTLSCALFI